MGDLSKNFSKKEFACSHCNRVYVEPALVNGCQKLRDKTGRAVHILSGYRCAVHNKRIGGAPNSMHLAGRAADIQVEGLSTKEVLDECLQIPEFTGVGYYPQEHFVHVDTRPLQPKVPRTTWARVNGKYTTLDKGLGVKV